ncbi:MAG TPA: cytochrome c3 family protein [Gemmatimonadales bacterium]
MIAAVGVPALLMVWVRTPPVTGQHDAPRQPVEFSHQLHVKGFRIDCRYCHSTVERTASAGMPSSQTCIPCHNQVWRTGPLFAPVRRSLASGQPIPWVRVNRLPDFVFFNHAIHVSKGVGCETCHGRVDQMARVQQAAPLTMGWCLDCHRNPEPRLRPVSQMTTMGYRPPSLQAQLDEQLARTYHVQRLVTCTACHR